MMAYIYERDVAGNEISTVKEYLWVSRGNITISYIDSDKKGDIRSLACYYPTFVILCRYVIPT